MLVSRIKRWAAQMKRYRILSFDFDTRALTFDTIEDHWEEPVKALHRQNCENTINGLKWEFGERNFEQKLENFKAIGSKPFSVVAFHNRFFSQARSAFVNCEYYPALTGVCALGERVLNHLLIGLREKYRWHEHYKRVFRKDSFDYWPLAIDVLTDWGILQPATTESFRRLAEKRNAAIHFNPEADKNDRQLALDAIKNFGEIIACQFSAFGQLPWLLCVLGEMYIAKDWENHPFIEFVYRPNCLYLGYKHQVLSAFPWCIQEAEDYAEANVSDEEFVLLRTDFQSAA